MARFSGATFRKRAVEARRERNPLSQDTEARITVAKTINDGTLVVPAKAVIWRCLSLIGVLVAGYVAIFGWLAVEVVEIGRDVASIEVQIRSLHEGQEDHERGLERVEDLLLEILRQRNGIEE